MVFGKGVACTSCSLVPASRCWQRWGPCSLFKACPCGTTPWEGRLGSRISQQSSSIYLPVSGFVYPLILQACFAVLRARFSALAPVSRRASA